MDRFEASLQSRASRSEHQDLKMGHNEEPAVTNDRSRVVHPSSYYPVPSAILLGREFLEPPPTRLDPQDESMLSFDMLELYESLLPTKESHVHRLQLVEKINKILKNEWPSYDISTHVFGSSQNRLATTYSDVDICIETNRKELENVRILAKSFKKHGMQRVQCIPWAKVPIVRLWDKDLNLACDINVNNTVALHNTKMVRTFIDIDPRVRPLTMIIKHWAKQRQLTDAGNGGTLSIYAWICMILNFLQMRQPPILPILHDTEGKKPATWFNDDLDSLYGFGTANSESVGGLLYAFIRHYAVEFDYEKQVISLRHGTHLDKSSKGWDFGRNYRMLCIEEPFDTSRNLGNSADDISIFGLRREFQRALAALSEKCSIELLCKPYVAHIAPEVLNWDGDNVESEEAVVSVNREEYDTEGVQTTNKPLETPNTRTPIDNAQRPPGSKMDLDNIYTDTVARVKLPSRHRSTAVKKDS
ncbi:hypothetical protein K450DRAFT_243716 [Umbelopsis ramanniana AG]|uniref:polynucleotide adenylyltransferase n=1 Tax=Umbelopsis ramanniana AG TaxID=1314678 RepID=A0AAD5E9X7_UMBRA|nr:uncharacterized protein K450DRAFT_243716 [Umbelopsis ramanniana AG]KAI8579071.1 hypothetical protein K450DRAFT_243716 [Umbelopsis ramanniana AG]